MDWTEAKEGTLELWRNIRRMLDEPDEMSLLTEINAMCDLCERAKEQDSDSLDMCRSCLAYQQFGGCRGVNLEMSERCVARDWEGLRVLIDDFIVNLEGVELPPSEPAH